MKYSSTVKLSSAVMVLTLLSGAAFAQAGRTDLGKSEYESKCAVCHGLNGKGTGPYVEFLRAKPTDLTILTKQNAGVFPVGRMYETIEGANVPSHGSREMPIWGTDYKLRAAEYYGDVNYNPEAYVRPRILALIEYISRFQER